MSESRVAVVGAGFGGLAAALRLQSAGIPTVLLERRDRPGGRAYVYEQDGFRFDAGPTVVTARNCIDELFALRGKATEDYVELLPVQPFYRLVWPDGITLEYNADADSVAEAIRQISPADADGYKRFLAYSAATFENGYLKLGTVPFQDPWSMIRRIPLLAGLKAYRSAYDVVASYMKDPHLRQAFSFQSLLIGGNPFKVSAIYTLIHALEREWGVHFPRGGTHSLVLALAKRFQELGGELRLNTPVTELRERNGRITEVATADGRSVPVRAVVSNADVMHTYASLLKGTARGQAMARTLARKRYSMSLFVVHFGLKRQHPGLAHHSVLFGPRYKELLEDIFERGVLAEDFSIYLHNPTASDQSLAPPGQAGFYALTPVPHLGKAAIDWSVEGPKLAERMLTALERTVLPGLRQDLVTQRIFTPSDFASELNAHLGSAFSLEPVLTQSAFFRVHNRDDRIGNLYFVGAGTHPGAGIPGVVGSAKATAGLMLQDLGVV
ncbi:MAG: phytoene desaturase [Chromatiales bacterium]|jgi:phytoene desaturase|nr:phytoene desaturase [Chromatiales bacterium]